MTDCYGYDRVGARLRGRRCAKLGKPKVYFAVVSIEESVLLALVKGCFKSPLLAAVNVKVKGLYVVKEG